MKHIFIIFIGLSMCQSLDAQTKRIQGLIKDKSNGNVLKDVLITGLNLQQISDSNGYFRIESEETIHELVFTKFGYLAQKKHLNTFEKNWGDTLQIVLSNSSILLSEVAVSADKPLTAASSKFLNAIDFENRPRQSAQDLLRLVPGLFIAQHAGGGKAEQIFIRGFDCDHGTDIASFVDGMPVNMPSHGHGQGYMDLHFVIPEIVNNMAIVKGPYQARFGNFATGAAVEMNTADSVSNNLLLLEGSGTAGIKTMNGKRVLSLLQIPESNEKLNSYAAVEYIHNRAYFDAPQDFSRFNLFTKTVFQVNKSTAFKLSASAFNSSWNASGQIPERAVKQGIITRFGSIDATEGGSTSRQNLNLSLNKKSGRDEWSTQVYASSYQFKLFSNFTFFANDSINGDQIEQGDLRTIYGINSQYQMHRSWYKLNQHTTIGAQFRADQIDNGLWTAVRRKRLNSTAEANIQERASGLYMNTALRFSDHFRLELGARYDYITYNVTDKLPSDTNRSNYSGFNYQSLFSPKINMVYSVNPRWDLFVNAGSGYHSNDARSVVQDLNQHQLPRSIGAELGTLLHISRKMVISAAFWRLDLENELVYVGDDGTTENKGASNRVGIDISWRYQITPWLFADADINVSKNTLRDAIFGKQLEKDFYIPLAPTLTSTAGLSFRKKRWNTTLRYRHISDRPANEANTVKALGYTVVDALVQYQWKKYRVGMSIENLLNTEWNEAQFDTESRLRNESQSVSELHYTPGIPFTAKLSIAYSF
jgi:outer membrane receptor protein involved in Fe transport